MFNQTFIQKSHYRSLLLKQSVSYVGHCTYDSNRNVIYCATYIDIIVVNCPALIEIILAQHRTRIVTRVLMDITVRTTPRTALEYRVNRPLNVPW